MNGICLTETLFHAAIEGLKTQARWIMKPQPTGEVFEWSKKPLSLDFPEWEGDFYWLDENEGVVLISPPYKVGEILYLKEPYCVLSDGLVLYRYSVDGHKYRMKNKQSMPEEYARYFIEITGVRCERLQEISDEDCLREGIYCKTVSCEKDMCGTIHYAEPTKRFYSHSILWHDGGNIVYKTFCTPREAYAALINSIYGGGTWESNPYVWPYEFKLKKI